MYVVLGTIGLMDFGFDPPNLAPNPSFGPDLTPLIPFDWDFVQKSVDLRFDARILVVFQLFCGVVCSRLRSGGFLTAFGMNSIAKNMPATGQQARSSPVRNMVLAVLITQSMHSTFAALLHPSTDFDHSNLLGETCEISTSQADSNLGKPSFERKQLLLLLNIRTDGAVIRKGGRATIIDFDPDKRIFTVTPSTTEQPS